MTDDQLPVYTSAAPPVPSPDELANRIPGWGIDLDPAVRPSYPMDREERTGAHWEFPDRQPEAQPREKSIEHEMLPPVFGTTVPLKGLSGRLRRYSYDNYSEGHTAHWLLLLAADRLDSLESHLASFGTGRPDNPITQTGIAAEFKYPRSDSNSRADGKHNWLDPLIVAGPWIAAAGLGAVALRWLLGVRRAVRGVVRRRR